MSAEGMSDKPEQKARMLRCRWCGFAVPAVYTNRKGIVRSGWQRLASHQKDRHPDEADVIAGTLASTDEQRSREDDQQEQRDARLR